MAWFKKARKPMESATAQKPSRVPEGLWVKCPDCSQAIYNKDLATNLNVCPKCAHHFRISAAERLRGVAHHALEVLHAASGEHHLVRVAPVVARTTLWIR